MVEPKFQSNRTSLNSSITQLVSGYQFTSRFALQINVPLIYREFRRPEGFEIQQGTVSGIGDMSLLLKRFSSITRRRLKEALT